MRPPPALATCSYSLNRATLGDKVATPPAEKRGAIYTERWVVELLLDLAGYSPEADLAEKLAVEPAAGEGAFLVAMAERLLASCRRYKRPLSHGKAALLAYELQETSAQSTRDVVAKALSAQGVPA